MTRIPSWQRTTRGANAPQRIARKNEQAEPRPTPADAPSEKKPEPLTIVGIGASAGGLAALKTFFEHVPEDSGLAYVIVVHLSPKHESHLPELLQPHIHMPVRQVTETMSLEPNQVYVTPPNANLDTIDTHLRLTELEARRQERAPIDHFFRTLAKTHDGAAIGVILTGSGSDGTLGLREIKERGGLAIVQDPTEAEYDGMPQSAIATGLVDLGVAVGADSRRDSRLRADPTGPPFACRRARDRSRYKPAAAKGVRSIAGPPLPRLQPL